MESKVESLVDLINEFCEKEVEEKINFDALSEVSGESEDFPNIRFFGDEENDSGYMVMIDNDVRFLPSLSNLEYTDDIDELFELFLEDYEEVLDGESNGRILTGWQVYYKEMFETIFSKKEIELIRSKYGKK